MATVPALYVFIQSEHSLRLLPMRLLRCHVLKRASRRLTLPWSRFTTELPYAHTAIAAVPPLCEAVLRSLPMVSSPAASGSTIYEGNRFFFSIAKSKQTPCPKASHHGWRSGGVEHAASLLWVCSVLCRHVSLSRGSCGNAGLWRMLRSCRRQDQSLQALAGDRYLPHCHTRIQI